MLEVELWKMDDEERFGIAIDGIIGVAIPFIIIDKFPGLLNDLVIATEKWARNRTIELKAREDQKHGLDPANLPLREGKP